MLDFEHFQLKGSPFYDLATLIIHPILISYEESGSKQSLSCYMDIFVPYIQRWVELYSKLSGLPMTEVKSFAQIAANEQRNREYPYYRDPNTFPMNDTVAFNELTTREFVHE